VGTIKTGQCYIFAKDYLHREESRCKCQQRQDLKHYRGELAFTLNENCEKTKN
jgi:hypothetical protein